MPRKKSATKTPKKETASKADFVRSHAALGAADVVEKAKAAGIKLDVGYIYNVRSTDKASKKKTATPKKAGPAKNGSPSASNETTFRKLVVSLGIDRSRALIADVERGIAAVIAGR